jgi:hypothetical protein
MQVVAPSDEAVAVLRAISRGGFSYDWTKELAQAAGRKLVEDEFDLGYVTFSMWLVRGQDVRCRLAVELRKSGRPPRAFAPLFCFEEFDTQREPFDDAYRSLAEQLAAVVGPASSASKYSYPHREDWLYSYSWWSLNDTAFVLVQDEFDIQFGMDVTLWVLPARAGVELPVSRG